MILLRAEILLFQPFQLACQEAQGTLKDDGFLLTLRPVCFVLGQGSQFFYTLTLFGHKIGAPIWPIHKNY